MHQGKEKQNNYAYIDFHNLFYALKSLGWLVDYEKFRKYLAEHYGITKAYIFIGFVEENQQLYNKLQSSGFILIFKPVLIDNNHKIKGNCDAELVLQAMIDFNDYKEVLSKVLAPSIKNCSSLLKRVAKKKIALVSDLRSMIEYKKRTS